MNQIQQQFLRSEERSIKFEQELKSSQLESAKSKQKAKQKLAKARENETNAREQSEQLEEELKKSQEQTKEFQKALTEAHEQFTRADERAKVADERAEKADERTKTADGCAQEYSEKLEKNQLFIEELTQTLQNERRLFEEKCLEISRLCQEVLDQRREKTLMDAECQGLRSTVQDLRAENKRLECLLSQKNQDLINKTNKYKTLNVCFETLGKSYEFSQAKIESLEQDLVKARNDARLFKTDMLFLGVPFLICAQKTLTDLSRFTSLASKVIPM